ncbi:hypothetical protein [Geminocystis sp.]|uniref:hypothetical protein n=1 Tax=Geminocystis sp. TaxID=2664100 RepID=UPI003592F2B9
MVKIVYIDLEFKDKKIGEKIYKQPTEIGYAWFSNKKHLNFKHYQFDYNEKHELVLKLLKEVIEEAKNKYNFDTLIFWDNRQDIKIIAEAKVDLSKFKIEDIQEDIANLTNNHRLSLEVINKLFNLPQQLENELKHLSEEEKKLLKLHTALGDSTRIAIIHKNFKENQNKFINQIKTIQKISESSPKNSKVIKTKSSEKSVDLKIKQALLKKSILQNIPLKIEQIKGIKEGILLLLGMETLSEEERQLEEQILKEHKYYQLVKTLQEKNYDVRGFTGELLKINRFLKINFDLTIKDLYDSYSKKSDN